LRKKITILTCCFLAVRKFGTSLDMNGEDWDELDGSLNGYGSSSVDGTLTMERSKETAETSHITTSEQEEKQTFVITCTFENDFFSY